MSWQLDPMHTQVEFAVKHFGMMTVRGRFNNVRVTGTADPDYPEATSLDVTIDVASLNTHDAQRDNDLRGSMFLELDKYPTITFHSSKLEQTGPARQPPASDLRQRPFFRGRPGEHFRRLRQRHDPRWH